jgi:hypothetical protein
MIKKLKLKVKVAQKKFKHIKHKIATAKRAKLVIKKAAKIVQKTCINAAKGACPCSLVRSLRKSLAKFKGKVAKLTSKMLKLRLLKTSVPKGKVVGKVMPQKKF